jgi:hypothetical protein
MGEEFLLGKRFKGVRIPEMISVRPSLEFTRLALSRNLEPQGLTCL